MVALVAGSTLVADDPFRTSAILFLPASAARDHWVRQIDCGLPKHQACGRRSLQRSDSESFKTPKILCPIWI